MPLPKSLEALQIDRFGLKRVPSDRYPNLADDALEYFQQALATWKIDQGLAYSFTPSSLGKNRPLPDLAAVGKNGRMRQSSGD